MAGYSEHYKDMLSHHERMDALAHCPKVVPVGTSDENIRYLYGRALRAEKELAEIRKLGETLIAKLLGGTPRLL